MLNRLFRDRNVKNTIPSFYKFLHSKIKIKEDLFNRNGKGLVFEKDAGHFCWKTCSCRKYYNNIQLVLGTLKFCLTVCWITCLLTQHSTSDNNMYEYCAK